MPQICVIASQTRYARHSPRLPGQQPTTPGHATQHFVKCLTGLQNPCLQDNCFRACGPIQYALSIWGCWCPCSISHTWKRYICTAWGFRSSLKLRHGFCYCSRRCRCQKRCAASQRIEYKPSSHREAVSDRCNTHHDTHGLCLSVSVTAGNGSCASSAVAVQHSGPCLPRASHDQYPSGCLAHSVGPTPQSESSDTISHFTTDSKSAFSAHPGSLGP